jgi:hypothetical protein
MDEGSLDEGDRWMSVIGGGWPRECARATSRSLGAARALNLPRAARVRSREGAPYEVNGERMESVRESWLVEDRWWTERPLRRRYWELVSARGRNLIVFRDLTTADGNSSPGGWFIQGS